MFFFFFFKQKTAYEIKECDWSSDVCSSDLERELQHVFASRERGFINLGLGGKISKGKLAGKLLRLIEDSRLRREMQYKVWRWDGLSGVEKVIDIILGRHGH